MRPLRLSELARDDVDDIWLYTAQTFDERQADRYILLIQQALNDIEQDPERIGSQSAPELGATVRRYHIRLSRKRSGTGLGDARHLVIYTLARESETYILRVLHEAMDLEQQVSPESDA
jgi:toxin ParE1/3/4